MDEKRVLLEMKALRGVSEENKAMAFAAQRSLAMVKLFQAGRKQNQRLAYQEKDTKTVERWGQLSFYQSVDHRLGQGQLAEIAKNVLREKNRVEKRLVIETVNSDVVFYPGQTVLVEIPDLAEKGIMGKTLIEGCTYLFSNGKVEGRLQMRME